MSPIFFAGVGGGLALVLTAVFTPAVRAAAIHGGLVRQVQADRWCGRVFVSGVGCADAAWGQRGVVAPFYT
ncbi:MAG: hypothetical protein ACKVG4_16395 [Longimicrobiales bacterium]